MILIQGFKPCSFGFEFANSASFGPREIGAHPRPYFALSAVSQPASITVGIVLDSPE
jgi:hypothetical protein